VKLVFVLQDALTLEAAFIFILQSNAVAASQEPPLPPFLLAVVQTSATGIDGVADHQKLNRAWAAPPALPAGLGTQHLKYFAGLSSTLLNLRECQPAIALLRASAHILSMESTSEPVAYHSFLANFAGLLMKQVSLQMCMLSMQLRSFAGFVNRLLLAHVTVQDVKKLKSINLLNTCHA